MKLETIIEAVAATPIGRKFRKVMGEYGKGTLKSSSGEKVTDIAQAKAIAYSEQRRARKKSRKKK